MKGQRDPLPRLCDVLVVQSRSPAARYRFDVARGAYILDAIDAPDTPSNLGRAVVAHTGVGDEALPVLLLCRVPLMRDVVVPARPIALVEHVAGAERRRWVVAVAAPDTAFDDVVELTHLDRFWQATLHRALRAERADGALWHGCEVAWQAIRQERERYRAAQAAQRRQSQAHPQWLTTVNPSLADVEQMPLPHTSDVEARMGTLPLRFRRYLADYLFRQERVLAWVGRPALRSARERGFLRGKRLEQGVLIVTDAQLLFLEEIMPPDSADVRHGCTIRTTALEQLRHIGVDAAGQTITLAWNIQALAGDETLAVEFPIDLEKPVRRLAERLAPFVDPPSGSYPLRRIYRPEAISPDLRDPSANDTANDPILAELSAKLESLRAPTEEWAAQAYVPPWAGEYERIPELLAVSPQRLLRVRPAGHASPSYAIAEISSLELRAAVLGSWIALHMPRHDQLDRVMLRFPFTGFGFVDLFGVLRQFTANVPDASWQP